MATFEAESPLSFSKSLSNTTLIYSANLLASVSSGFINWKRNGVYLFGENFRQDATKIYITKSDLEGLTPDPNNSPSEILTALLYRAMKAKANTSTSMIEISIWKTVFKPSRQGKIKVVILEVKVIIPLRYKYELVEIANANDSNIIKYL